MEIVRIDCRLVVNGCQFVSLAQTVGNEGTVVDSLRHIAIVARKQQYMVEIEVARLENTHYLDALSRFAMKGDRS